MPVKKDGVVPSDVALEGGVGGFDGMTRMGISAATAMPDTMWTTIGILSSPLAKLGIKNMPRIAP